MKLVLISDTHSKHHYLSLPEISNPLPEGDLLIHAGDLTGIGEEDEVEDVFDWFKVIAPRYTHGIVFIAGNHDKSFDPKYNKEQPGKKPEWLLEKLENLPKNICYLENSSVSLGGLNIWGSPITPWFFGEYWAFNRHRNHEINQVWEEIPSNTDVLVTHGPPLGYGDYVTTSREWVGCDQLRQKVHSIKPKAHVFGHIHEGYGVMGDSNTVYVNASTCNERYRPYNKPVILHV